MDISDSINLFGRGNLGTIKVAAQNAWLEGKDADANPYDSTVYWIEHGVWYREWFKCNKYG